MNPDLLLTTSVGDPNALSNTISARNWWAKQLYCLPSTPRHKIKYLEPPKPSNTFKNHLLSICQQSSSVGLQVLFLALICQPSRPEINGKIRFAQDWSYSLAHMIHWSAWIQIKTEYTEWTVSFQHKVPAEASRQGRPFCWSWTVFPKPE